MISEHSFGLQGQNNKDVPEKNFDIFAISNLERIESIRRRIDEIDLFQINYRNEEGHWTQPIYTKRQIELILSSGKKFDYIDTYAGEEIAGSDELIKEKDLPCGIEFVFSKQDHNYWNDTTKVRLYCLDDSFHQDYVDVMRMISLIKERQLDPDRKAQLGENLERRRRDIHDRGASEIITRMIRDKIDIPFDIARKLYEILTDLWMLNNKGSISISADHIGLKDALDRLNMNALAEQINVETGIEADISSFTFGYHEDDPRTQINIELTGDNVNLKMKRIHEIINTEISKLTDEKFMIYF